jgi:hypothetical protein
MTDDDSLPTLPRLRRFIKPESRPDIKLPNGKTLKPRARMADEMGVSERTVKRLNAETAYIANVAYVNVDSVLQLIGDTLKRRNQPPRRRR